MEITLSAVIEAARLRRAGVTAEGAGYVVLLAVQELTRSPRRVSADGLLLTELGELRVVDGGAPAPDVLEADVENDLRQLLASLTSLAQSVSPALKIAAERASVGRLNALEGELMAALIPINHAAARRALARLYREAHKSRVDSLTLAAESGTLSTPSPLPTPSPQAAGVAPRAATPRPAPVSVAQQGAMTPSPPPTSVAPKSAPAWSTPPPASVARPVASDVPAVGADLDIEVDVVAFEDVAPPRVEVATPAATARASAVPVAFSPPAADPEPLDEPSSHRSDLRELLAGFLAHTRSEEQMTADLRRMIGLEAPPLPRPSAAPPPMLPASTHVR